MPRLILFAACEKVITDTDGLVSLITLIERLEASVPASVQIPPRTAVPMRWQTLAIWRLASAEMGQDEQMTQLLSEDGSVAMETEPMPLVSTTPSKIPGVKITGILTAVPLTDGVLRLKLYHRKIGDQNWIESAEYPVEVVVVRT